MILNLAVILLLHPITGYLKSFFDTKSVAVDEDYVRVVVSVRVK